MATAKSFAPKLRGWMTRTGVIRWVAIGLTGAGVLMGMAEPGIGQMRLAQAEASSEVGGIEPFTLEGTLDENSEFLNEQEMYFNIHPFEGQAGQQIRIEMTSNEVAPLLVVMQPNEEVLAVDTNPTNHLTAQLVVTLPSTGTYTIVAAAKETGRYNLSLQPASSQAVAAAEQLAEAERLNQQVIELYQQGRYADAIPLAQRVLEIRETVLGEDHPDVAQSLNNLAALYKAQGNYAQAELLYQRSLQIREMALGEDHPDVATSLNNLAGLYRAQGNYAQAEPLYARSLQIRETVLGEDHPDVANSLNNLALLYQDQGNYAQAEPLLQRSLQIRETVLGEDHPDVANSLNNLALLYQDQGNYAQAEPLLQRSLQILETALGEDHPDVAASLNNLAGLYQDQGNYAQAEPLYARSLQIRETVLGEDHPDVANSLNNLALLYQDQGNYSQAEPLYQRSLQIWETALGEDHPDVAASLNGLADLYQAQGNYAQAEPLYVRSLQIREMALGEDHPDVAQSLNNLAELYQAQGNYAQAEPLYVRSLQIFETALGDDHPNVATSLNNLAELYRAQGNYSQAEPLYQRSLQIFETALGEDHPDVATSLNNLAALYQAQGNYAQAEPLYVRSLQIFETALGDDHPDVANSLNNLAELYRAQGNYSQAEPLYQRSLQIWETALGEDHPDVATSLNNLAALYQAQGNYAQAEPLYVRSLQISETALGEDHPDVASSLNNLALLYHAQNDLPQAIEFLRSGLAVEETNLASTLAIGSEARKQAYVRTIAGTTNRTISLHQQAAPTNPDAARLALTTVFRRKGRILDAVTNSFQRLRQNLSPDEQSLLEDYTAVQTQLATLLYGGLGDQDPDAYRAAVDRLRQDSERLENDLAQRSAEFRVESEPIDIETVQALIPDGAVWVELVRYEPFDPTASQAEQWGKPRYAAYTLDTSGTIQSVDLGDAATIDQAIDGYLYHLQQYYALDPSSLNQASRNLDALVMAPIRELIGNTTHLLISPDGQLNLIPFAALVDENNQYLVENYQFTYLTSGRDLPKLQLDTPSQQPPVILANPTYDTPGNPNPAEIAAASPLPNLGEGPGVRANSTYDTPGNPNPAEIATNSASPLPALGEGPGVRVSPLPTLGEGPGVRAIRRSTDLATLEFNPLPGTQIEADAIAPLLPNATLLTDTNATENALKQLDAPTILHIATHGFFLEDVEFVPPAAPLDNRGITLDYFDNPNATRNNNRPSNNENPLLRSGLALAGFNSRQSGNEDGVLTALEASSLNLSGTELVVLSACDTGVGDVANGEGVYGLRRAFVMAGADSLMMSLWQVSDQGTADLMTRYYQRILNGEGRSVALRNTQLDMMQTSGYEHPYYWASFIFSGDWRSLN